MARQAKAANRRAAGSAESGSDTRIRLLLAAEKLFGEHGIDGVSLRQIRMEAKQLNSSAVQYHFSDRDDLVRAVLAYRVAQMEPRRKEMLQQVKAQGQEADLLALMQVICLPQLELVAEDGRYPFVRFSAEYLTRYRPRGIAHPGDDATRAPALYETMEFLYQVMFSFDRDVALMRITGAALLFLNSVVRHDLGVHYQENLLTMDVIVGEALNMAVAALRAPPSMALRERYQKH